MEKSNKGFGPVIYGVAATNRPHLNLKDYPLSVVDIDGQKFIRVPMLPKGKFKHPDGTLEFNDEFFDKVIENHEKRVWDYPPFLMETHKGTTSLGSFDPKDGAFLKREDKILVGYAKPSNERAIKKIEEKEYSFASPEIRFNYSSNELENKSLDFTKLEEILEGDIMTDNINLEALQSDNEKLKTRNEELSLKLKDTDVKLESKDKEINELKETVVALEAKVAEYNKEQEKSEEVVKLEAQIAKLEQARNRDRSDALLENLKVFVENKKGYPAGAINLVEAIFAKKVFGANEVSLESVDNNVDIYYQKAIVEIFKNYVTPEVNLESQTNGDEVELEATEVTLREAGQKLWEKENSNGKLIGV